MNSIFCSPEQMNPARLYGLKYWITLMDLQIPKHMTFLLLLKELLCWQRLQTEQVSLRLNYTGLHCIAGVIKNLFTECYQVGHCGLMEKNIEGWKYIQQLRIKRPSSGGYLITASNSDHYSRSNVEGIALKK